MALHAVGGAELREIVDRDAQDRGHPAHRGLAFVERGRDDLHEGFREERWRHLLPALLPPLFLRLSSEMVSF